MEEEKLYCPDFYSVFGEKFANPFWFDNIDAQLWPIIEGIDFPKEVENLLSLKHNDHPLFYRRKITLEQMLLELDSGNFKTGLVQALEIGQKYGIPNKFCLEVAEKSNYLSPIISVIPGKSGLGEVKIFYESFKKKGGIAAVVIYPAYQNVDILDENIMKDFCSGISEIGLPLKIDVSDLHLPNMDCRKISPDVILTFCSYVLKWAPNLKIIIGGAAISTDLVVYVDKLKFNRNIYLEINHRTYGGVSPKGYVSALMELKGFISNWWSRILFSSGTPTLEPSQMMRGFLEATDSLDFPRKCLMRTWGFRNGWRIFGNMPRKYPEIKMLNSAIIPKFELMSENNNPNGETHLGYDMSFQSFSITQLISITCLFEELFEDVLKRYPKMTNGQVTIKSYHTTTSLMINEHEYGNFLQLHYILAESTRDNADNKLHTVAALENRADFNFPDHILASNFGQRSITLPIRNGKLNIGGRENIYAIVTFGPRKIKISADFHIF